MLLPMQMPSYSEEQIVSLKDKTFGQAAAEVLNVLFGTRLGGWDVDFCIGRYPVRLVHMSHRIVIGETWHNLDWDFQRIVRDLTELVAGENNDQPGEWAGIAVRIASLFGVFAELMRSPEYDPETAVDLAVASGDFYAPMAAVYARSWGLPIGNIIVCCNENSAPWDLIYKGELRTAASLVNTVTPECDRVVPEGLERFVHLCGGREEVARYLECCHSGSLYCPGETVYPKMRSNTHASVVSGKRVLSAIPNVYKTSGILFGPYTALAYCGLLDYRARTGDSRLAVVLSERSPVLDETVVSSAMGLKAEAEENSPEEV